MVRTRLFVVGAALVLAATAAAAAAPCEGRWSEAEVVDLSKDRDRLSVRDTTAATAEAVELAVPEAMRERVRALAPGHRVVVAFRCSDPAAPGPASTLRSLDWPSAAQPRAHVVLLVAGCAGLLALLAFLLLQAPPWRLAVGLDNRYSTSKFQVLLWFWAVLSSYLAYTLARLHAGGIGFVGGIDIPGSLLTLSGISTLSFATAKGITASKVQTTAAAGSEAKMAAEQAQASDLVRDDFQRLSLSDLQVVLLTLVAVALYLVSVVAGLETLPLKPGTGLPEIDGTLLGLLGVSHAGYLGVKAASEPGAALTPQQAAARGDALLDTLRQQGRRVTDALERARRAAADAASGLKLAAKASTRAEADPGAGRAESARVDVTAAATEAEAARAALRTSADELLRLVQAWGSHDVAGPAVRRAATEGEALSAQAQADAAEAARLRLQSETDAGSALRQRDAKS